MGSQWHWVLVGARRVCCVAASLVVVASALTINSVTARAAGGDSPVPTGGQSSGASQPTATQAAIRAQMVSGPSQLRPASAAARASVSGAQIANPLSSAARQRSAPTKAAAPAIVRTVHPALAAGDWTQGGHDSAHDGYNLSETTIDPSNVGNLTLAWRGATGATGIHSSPAVANGVIYVGADDDKLYAFAVGCNSGGNMCAPLWTGVTGGPINSAPAVDGGVVYVQSDDGKLYAFAVGCASGGGTCHPIWTATIGSGGRHDQASPTVANGIVYATTWNGTLYAFAVGCASGGGACSPLWTSGPAGAYRIYMSVAVADGVVYAAGWNGSGSLLAYAADCGTGGAVCSPIWSAPIGSLSGNRQAGPAVSDGVVYVASADGTIYAFAVGCSSGGRTCTPIWTAQVVGGDLGLAVGDGLVFFSDGIMIYVYAVGCNSGGGSCDPLWTGFAPSDTAPVVADGVVFTGPYAYAEDCARDGGACAPIWANNWGLTTTPVVSNGAIYAGHNGGWLLAYSLPTRLVLSPSSSIAAPGDQVSFSAEAYDASGNDLGDVTASTTFQSYWIGYASCIGHECTITAPSGQTADEIVGRYGSVSASAMVIVGPVISGSVSNGTHGIAGLEVLAFDPADGTEVGRATTRADGSWSIAVPAGPTASYSISYYVSAGTYASGYLGSTGFTYDLGLAKTIAVMEGDVTGQNVVLPLALHIAGSVTGPGSSDLSGIDVYALPVSGDPFISGSTDASGAYSMVVPPGSYSIWFSDPNGVYASGYWSSTGYTQTQPGEVDVTTGDQTGIHVELPVGVHLSGTVQNKGAADLPNINVCFFDSNGHLADEEPTDQSGDFTDFLAPGVYYVGFLDPSGTYATGYWNGNGFSPDPAVMAGIDATAGGVAGIDVHLPLALGAPTDVTAARGDGSATVSWTAPVEDGGAPITGYAAVASDRVSNCGWSSGPLSCTVSGLTNGKPYTFVVHATNAGGPGPASDPSHAVTPGAAPGRPLHVTAWPGNGSAAVSWAPPVSDGGLPISTYVVMASDGTHTCTWSSGPLACTVYSLTVGQSYTFTVTATNDVGTGPVSDPSAAPIISGATYHAMTPSRVLDTRNGTGGLSGPFTNHAARTFTVAGVPAGATAVTGNLTVTGQTSGGYLFIGPAAATNPTSSTLNFPLGDDRANAVTVQLSPGGTLSITFVGPNNSQSAQAIFDVTGYFTPAG